MDKIRKLRLSVQNLAVVFGLGFVLSAARNVCLPSGHSSNFAGFNCFNVLATDTATKIKAVKTNRDTFYKDSTAVNELNPATANFFSVLVGKDLVLVGQEPDISGEKYEVPGYMVNRGGVPIGATSGIVYKLRDYLGVTDATAKPAAGNAGFATGMLDILSGISDMKSVGNDGLGYDVTKAFDFTNPAVVCGAGLDLKAVTAAYSNPTDIFIDGVELDGPGAKAVFSEVGRQFVADYFNNVILPVSKLFCSQMYDQASPTSTSKFSNALTLNDYIKQIASVYAMTADATDFPGLFAGETSDDAAVITNTINVVRAGGAGAEVAVAKKKLVGWAEKQKEIEAGMIKFIMSKFDATRKDIDAYFNSKVASIDDTVVKTFYASKDLPVPDNPARFDTALLKKVKDRMLEFLDKTIIALSVRLAQLTAVPVTNASTVSMDTFYDKGKLSSAIYTKGDSDPNNINKVKAFFVEVTKKASDEYTAKYTNAFKAVKAELKNKYSYTFAKDPAELEELYKGLDIFKGLGVYKDNTSADVNFEAVTSLLKQSLAEEGVKTEFEKTKKPVTPKDIQDVVDLSDSAFILKLNGWLADATTFAEKNVPAFKIFAEAYKEAMKLKYSLKKNFYASAIVYLKSVFKATYDASEAEINGSGKVGLAPTAAFAAAEKRALSTSDFFGDFEVLMDGLDAVESGASDVLPVFAAANLNDAKVKAAYEGSASVQVVADYFEACKVLDALNGNTNFVSTDLIAKDFIDIYTKYHKAYKDTVKQASYAEIKATMVGTSNFIRGIFVGFHEYLIANYFKAENIFDTNRALNELLSLLVFVDDGSPVVVDNVTILPLRRLGNIASESYYSLSKGKDLPDWDKYFDSTDSGSLKPDAVGDKGSAKPFYSKSIKGKEYYFLNLETADNGVKAFLVNLIAYGFSLFHKHSSLVFNAAFVGPNESMVSGSPTGYGRSIELDKARKSVCSEIRGQFAQMFNSSSYKTKYSNDLRTFVNEINSTFNNFKTKVNSTTILAFASKENMQNKYLQKTVAELSSVSSRLGALGLIRDYAAQPTMQFDALLKKTRGTKPLGRSTGTDFSS